MGGCRCTYRNCTVKTDGKTHMFHYPVFEKVRCHQWLVNAQKLEFLNLKVSQLKNRVVCQHHFKEDNFMNYMNDKLTFGAIPTEDGPYCDSNNYNLEEKPYSNLILLEDIESDYLFGNKKAIFSLKYGDFLTNGELMDTSTRYNSNNVENVNSANYNNCFRKATPIKPQSAKLGLASQDCINKDQIFIIQNPSDEIKFDENISKTLNKVHVTKPQSLCQEQSPLESEVSILQINQCQREQRLKKDSKVKILSETKINWPLPITGKFEKISPATTLLISEKKHEPIPEVSRNTSNVLNTNPTDDYKVLEVLDVEFLPKRETAEVLDKNVIVPSPKLVNVVKSQPSRAVLLNKSKLTPERTAAIERKRQFNMKLKNVIESCLNKIDDTPKIENKSNKNNKQKSILKDANVQAPTNSLKNESIKNFQDNTIAFMEARMNKMEETLLSRIDRNSQNIMELKSSFINIKTKDRKLVNAQTNTSKECYKNFLYREISPYLSEYSKSLIYEELFINKFGVTPTPKSYNRKRRKICV